VSYLKGSQFSFVLRLLCNASQHSFVLCNDGTVAVTRLSDQCL
jgi:hypothetical protein